MSAVAGRLLGVGTGPGDPDLLTLKAVGALRAAPVVAFFAKEGNPGNARRTVEAHLRPDRIELPLLYPVTTELPKDHPDYKRAILAFYERVAEAVAVHLSQGRDVAVLSEGDPLFYGSYMHLHVRLAHRFPTEVIPGVTAMAGCWAQAGLPITQGDDVLTVLPGTMAEPELARRLGGTEAAVIMKVGRNLGKIRRALTDAGRLDRAVYVERGTMRDGFCMALAEKPDDRAPYFSIVLVPGWQTLSDATAGDFS